MNPFTAPGRLTSGRRTYRGNKLFGGVANSHHLDGSAGDYVGTTADALRKFFGPSAQIIPESDHLHVQGLPPGTFPYYGNQGIAGLVNGTDPTAPHGAPTVAPQKKPRSLGQIALQPDLNAPSPISISSEPMQPTSLADLSLPQGIIPKKNNTGKTLANIAGVLGDALMAYGGMQPQFGPTMAREREQEADRAFDRERLNAMLEQKRQEALAPPQFAQNALWFQQQPKDVQQVILQSMDQTNPIFTATPQGTMVNKRYNGPPQEAINELRAAASKGDRGAIAEFEEVFGPGSARAYLGQ